LVNKLTISIIAPVSSAAALSVASGVGALSTTAAAGVYAAAGPVVVVTMDFGVRSAASGTT